MDVTRTHYVYLGETAEDEQEYEVRAVWQLRGWDGEGWDEYELGPVGELEFQNTTEAVWLDATAAPELAQALHKVLDREGLDRSAMTEAQAEGLANLADDAGESAFQLSHDRKHGDF